MQQYRIVSVVLSYTSEFTIESAELHTADVIRVIRSKVLSVFVFVLCVSLDAVSSVGLISLGLGLCAL